MKNNIKNVFKITLIVISCYSNLCIGSFSDRFTQVQQAAKPTILSQRIEKLQPQPHEHTEFSNAIDLADLSNDLLERSPNSAFVVFSSSNFRTDEIEKGSVKLSSLALPSIDVNVIGKENTDSCNLFYRGERIADFSDRRNMKSIETAEQFTIINHKNQHQRHANSKYMMTYATICLTIFGCTLAIMRYFCADHS